MSIPIVSISIRTMGTSQSKNDVVSISDSLYIKLWSTIHYNTLIRKEEMCLLFLVI